MQSSFHFTFCPSIQNSYNPLHVLCAGGRHMVPIQWIRQGRKDGSEKEEKWIFLDLDRTDTFNKNIWLLLFIFFSLFSVLEEVTHECGICCFMRKVALILYSSHDPKKKKEKIRKKGKKKVHNLLYKRINVLQRMSVKTCNFKQKGLRMWHKQCIRNIRTSFSR